MHSLKTLVLLALFMAVAPGAALAAAVTNLTGEAQTIEAGDFGNFRPVAIAANETWRVQGKVKIRFKGHENRVGEHEEYAIWPDGTFGPQRANMRGGRNF